MKPFVKLPVPYIYFILAGILLGVIFGAKTYLPFIYWDETAEYDWKRYFSPYFVNYTLWGFLAPVVYYFSQRYPWSKRSHLNIKLKAVFISLGVALFHEIFSNVLWFLPLDLLGIMEFTEKEWNHAIGFLPSALISRWFEYWIIYGLFTAYDYYIKYRDQQLELAQIENQLASAHLNALRLQLNPHFLFNTLNTISSLAAVDQKKAQQIVSKLGNLLRKLLEKNKRDLITLKEELEFIKDYLDIEHVRFQDRLSINYKIEDDSLQALVPSLILQPLVENAVKHGFSNQVNEGEIEVGARRINGFVELCVKDDGKGTAKEDTELLESGIGLKNVKDRLALIYKEQYKFILNASPDYGFEVKIQIPFQHENYSSFSN